ncbi:hypothetical protein AB0C34_09950 [Nocardia sp. NPDC049220]
MSIYAEIRARIAADKICDRAVIAGDRIEGARAEIVSDIWRA